MTVYIGTRISDRGITSGCAILSHHSSSFVTSLAGKSEQPSRNYQVERGGRERVRQDLVGKLEVDQTSRAAYRYLEARSYRVRKAVTDRKEESDSGARV